MRKNLTIFLFILTLFFTLLQACSKSDASTADNSIQSVIICNQVWATKNLDVNTYNDGTPIPQVTDPTAWAALTTGAWCYNNNDPAYGVVYGKLYNWYATVGIYDAASLANPALRKNLAPSGWHVPTNAEWTTMIDCLDPNANGGATIPNSAGGKMKETGTTHWLNPNTEATNSSGFTALPGGFRTTNGPFYSIGGGSKWWSSSEYSNNSARERNLFYNNGIAYIGWGDKTNGYSVRCIKD